MNIQHSTFNIHYLKILLFINFLAFSQSNNSAYVNLSPGGKLETIFDNSGNQYTLRDIMIRPKKHNVKNAMLNSNLLCTPGIFNLYFEDGSGMEAPTGIEAQRRAIVCQVYQDLSNFINAPAGTHVNIWVRDITQLSNVSNQTIGLATGFYNLPSVPNLALGGIADNEIWKTIHAGVDSYTNVALPIFSTGGTVNFYHGMMAIKFNGIAPYTWNLNLNAVANSSEIDLYTVVLHEVTHALGFSSLINSNGNSQNQLNAGNYYSRYDSFLVDHNANPLITNPASCSSMYDYSLAVDQSVLHPGCPASAGPDFINNGPSINTTACGNSLGFLGTNTAPVDVYTPQCFEKGGSLSHFEDECFVSTTVGATNGNDLYFVMSNGNGAGTTKRFLKPEERQALCDIGYSLNSSYGNATQHSFYFYGGSACHGKTVAGINDGINATGLIYNTDLEIPIQIAGILANDVASGITDNPNLRFECIEDISFADSIITINDANNDSNTTITFQSGAGAQGIHLLRYVPFDVVTGDRGNITYIYVNVRDCTIPYLCSIPYISQTYCDGVNNSFIEIKNSSYIESIATGTYYLNIYQNNSPTNTFPTSSINIGAFIPNQVKVFQTSTATNPAYANTGLHNLPAIFLFDGVDDIITISTTKDEQSYDNRIDLVGNGNDNWCKEASLVRSGCANIVPRIDAFDYDDWARFELYELNNTYTQFSRTNPVLGRHNQTSLYFEAPALAWQDDTIDYMSMPDRSRIAIVNTAYSTGTNGSFECCSLNAQASIDIVANTYVSVENTLFVQPTSAINIQDKGSLVMVKDTVGGASGSVLIVVSPPGQVNTFKTTVGLNAFTDYVFWSTPLANIPDNDLFNTANTLFPASSFRTWRFYGFTNANYQDVPNWYNGLPSNAPYANGYDDDGNDYYVLSAAQRNQQLTAGLGYTTWPKIGCTDASNCDYTIQFSGKPNNGVVTVPVFHNAPSNSYANLVGNPYPSAIDLDKFFEVNAGLIDPVAYIWGRGIIDTPNSGNPGPYPISYSEDNYFIYNPTMMVTSINSMGNAAFDDPDIDGISNTGNLASCQSFFVTTKSNNPNISYNGNLIFNNSMRTKAPNTTFARNSNSTSIKIDNKLWLNLKSEKLSTQLGIAFLDNASDSFNSKEDVRTFSGKTLNFYTKTTEEDLIIDAQNTFHENKIIPLGITSLKNDNQEYTIGIEKATGELKNVSIFLEDKSLGKIIDITTKPYSFKLNNLINDYRFLLKFDNKKSIANTGLLNDINFVYNDKGLEIVSLTKNIKSIVINDLYTSTINASEIEKIENINSKIAFICIDSKYKIISVKVILVDGSIVTKKMMK